MNVLFWLMLWKRKHRSEGQVLSTAAQYHMEVVRYSLIELRRVLTGDIVDVLKLRKEREVGKYMTSQFLKTMYGW